MFSFQASSWLEWNCSCWWWIQGVEALGLQGKISRLFLLSFRLVSYMCDIVLELLFTDHCLIISNQFQWYRVWVFQLSLWAFRPLMCCVYCISNWCGPFLDHYICVRYQYRLQHVCLSNWDHRIQWSHSWIQSTEHWSCGLLCWLQVHPSSLDQHASGRWRAGGPQNSTAVWSHQADIKRLWGAIGRCRYLSEVRSNSSPF